MEDQTHYWVGTAENDFGFCERRELWSDADVEQFRADFAGWCIVTFHLIRRPASPNAGLSVFGGKHV